VTDHRTRTALLLPVALTAVFLPAIAAIGFGLAPGASGRIDTKAPRAISPQASRIEHDGDIAVRQPGPHEGGGQTTAYPFFAEVADLQFHFRKRALHPGSAIGYHEQKEDEIYYVLSGTGEFTLDGTRTAVGPGAAMLTRPGSSHGLRQTGGGDLVILVVYRRSAPAAAQ
jgi:mannose-6-phosphate isomerase-like protein (cupin superfamily)